MTTKGILMSGPMVRALLDGSKTQTRRVLKQPQGMKVKPFGKISVAPYVTNNPSHGLAYYWQERGCWNSTEPIPIPYAVGDRLYVREAHAYHGTGWCNQTPDETKVRVEYLADNQDVEFIVPTKDVENFIPKQNKPKSLMVEEVTGDSDYDRALAQENWLADWWTRQKKRPPMFMFRHWSRLWLEVTDVRVQRVQDITEEDAKAEGVAAWAGTAPPPKHAFMGLWESLHGKTGHHWKTNPWVAAYTFTVHRGNVDE